MNRLVTFCVGLVLMCSMTGCCLLHGCGGYGGYGAGYPYGGYGGGGCATGACGAAAPGYPSAFAPTGQTAFAPGYPQTAFAAPIEGLSTF
jgi:hypothetical protein